MISICGWKPPKLQKEWFIPTTETLLEYNLENPVVIHHFERAVNAAIKIFTSDIASRHLRALFENEDQEMPSKHKLKEILSGLKFKFWFSPSEDGAYAYSTRNAESSDYDPVIAMRGRVLNSVSLFDQHSIYGTSFSSAVSMKIELSTLKLFW